MKKTVTGVVQWKKPSDKSPLTTKDFNQKIEFPGPGDYNLNSQNKKQAPSSVFASKVNRIGTGALIRAKSSQVARTNTVMSEMAKNMDVIDDDEEVEAPGPGAYYNQNQSSFKTGKKPEKLQFFGSTVERFNPG